MTFHQIYFHIFQVPAILAAVAAGRYLQYRTSVGRWGAVVLFDLAVIMGAHALQWSALPPCGLYAFYAVQVVGFYLLPILFAFFGYEFVREVESTDKRSILILIVVCFPVVLLAALLYLAFPTMSPEQMSGISPGFAFGLRVMLGHQGDLFVAYFFVVSSLCVFLSSRLLVLDEKPLAERLSLPMLLGSLFILAISMLEVAEVRPFDPISIVQIGLAVVCVVFFFYAVVYRFGGILPVSRDAAFDVMRDGILLLDANRQIVDANPLALTLLGLNREGTIHRNISAVWPEIAEAISSQPLATTIDKSIVVSGAYLDRINQVTITRLLGMNATTIGRMISMKNVTDLDRMEQALVDRSIEIETMNVLLRRLAETNLHIQATDDLASLYNVLNLQMSSLGLAFFITTYDSEADELALGNVSIHPGLMRRFENILGAEGLAGPACRDYARGLYVFLKDSSTDHVVTSFRDVGLAESQNLPGMLGSALHAIGTDPESLFLLFRLTAGDKIIGLMGVWGKECQQALVTPLRILSSQIAWAMERIRLYTQETQRAAESERSHQLASALARISAQMSKSSDSTAASEALGQGIEAIGLHCVIGRLNDAQDNIVFKYASFSSKVERYGRYLPSRTFSGYRLPKELWPRGPGIAQEYPFWYDDILGILTKVFPMVPRWVLEAAMNLIGAPLEDRLCVLPLFVDGEVTGILPIWGRGLRENDAPTLLVFAHQVSELLRKIEDYEEESRRADSLARSNRITVALSNVAAKLETTTDVREVFDTLGTELGKVNINSMVGILAEEKQFMKIEYLSMSKALDDLAHRLGLVWPSELRIPRRLWPTDKAVTERVPCWDPNPIGSASLMFPYIPEGLFRKAFEMVGMDLNAQVCYLPMICENEVIGILAVWGSELQDDDVPALSVFANQVSTAIRNTELLTRAQEEIRHRTQAEAVIQAALAEKEILLKEIHHRVKNNLQIISSLLRLQMAQSTDAVSLEVLRESQTRVRAMALIHEKLYQSDDLARIDFASYLRSLSTSLAQVYRLPKAQVSVQVEADHILLDLDTAIPCGLIVNELVSNALKHAFPDGRAGRVTIGCHQTAEDAYSLTIADDGIGIAADIDPEKGTSLGLRLVSNLVRQIGGQMAVEGKRGTRYVISF